VKAIDSYNSAKRRKRNTVGVAHDLIDSLKQQFSFTRTTSYNKELATLQLGLNNRAQITLQQRTTHQALPTSLSKHSNKAKEHQRETE
jgi:hypothetical protein